MHWSAGGGSWLSPVRLIQNPSTRRLYETLLLHNCAAEREGTVVERARKPTCAAANVEWRSGKGNVSSLANVDQSQSSILAGIAFENVLHPHRVQSTCLCKVYIHMSTSKNSDPFGP